MFYFSRESESFPFTQLLENVQKLLKATDSDRLAIVCCAISALTYDNNQGMDTYTTIVETFISKWVGKRLVIEGEMFGGKLETTKYLGMQTGKLVKEDEEFKV